MPTRLATKTDSSSGRVKGQPMRFIRGHNPELKEPRYLEQHRGYETPCWVWQLSKSPRGYGRVRVERRMQQAHRVYYVEKYGPIPDDLQLDHLCRVRECVNPDHLEVVTGAANVQRGLLTKLTEEDVREIRAACERGQLQKDIAVEYGVYQTSISAIKLRETWADV